MSLRVNGECPRLETPIEIFQPAAPLRMEFIADCRHPSPLALELLTLCLGADERWF